MKKEERLKNLIRRGTMGEEISTSCLKKWGYSMEDIRTLVNDGVLNRLRRGIYQISDLTSLGIKINNFEPEFDNVQAGVETTVDGEIVLIEENIFNEPLLKAAYRCYKLGNDELADFKIQNYIAKIVQNVKSNNIEFDITPYLHKFYYYATAGRDFTAARVYLNFIKNSASLSRLYEETHALEDYYEYHMHKVNLGEQSIEAPTKKLKK